jgi:hypothetical protein
LFAGTPPERDAHEEDCDGESEVRVQVERAAPPKASRRRRPAGGPSDGLSKLGTKEMQSGWKAMPAKDRTMMTGMMKEMSESTAQFSAEIKASGLLVVESAGATLIVKKEHRDANGSSSETWTQKYALDNGKCLISR